MYRLRNKISVCMRNLSENFSPAVLAMSALGALCIAGLIMYRNSRKKSLDSECDSISEEKHDQDTEKNENSSSAEVEALMEVLSTPVSSVALTREVQENVEKMVVGMNQKSLVQLPAISGRIHDGMNRWIFFHTIRKNKSVSFNPLYGGGVSDIGLSSPRKQVADGIAKTFRKAYWDKHKSDLLQDPVDFSQVLQRLAELNEKIESFVDEKIRVKIFPVSIDLSLIQDQVRNNNGIDIDSFVQVSSVVVCMLSKIESIDGHENTRKYFEEKIENFKESIKSIKSAEERRNAFCVGLVDALAFFFGQCDRVEAELDSFRLSLVNSDKRKQLEFDAFSDLVTNNLLEIPNLKSFALKNDYSKTSDPEVLLLDGFVSHFLESIFSFKNELKNIHEVLMLEVSQIERFSLQFANLVSLSTLCVSIETLKFFKKYIGGAVIEDVWKILNDPKDERNMLPVNLCACLTARIEDRSVISAEILEKMESMMKVCCESNDQISTLLRTRLKKILADSLYDQTRCVLSGNLKKIVVIPDAMGKNPQTLRIVERKAANFIDELLIFIVDFWSVYGEFYKRMAMI